MLLRQLRYFATVAEQGSVMRAATKLRLAQPALSRQLHSLENAVGAPLLDREPRGVRLTLAGSTLLATIKPLFDRLEEGMRRMHLANEGRLGTLRLGLSRVAIDSGRVGRAIMSLREHFPDVQLIVSEVGSPAHSQKLRDRELDLAIGLSGCGDASVATWPLFDFRVDSAVLPSGHPGAGGASVHASELAGARLLVVDPLVVGPFPQLYDQLRRLGVHEWEPLDSIETVYSHVAAGRGWTVAPTSLREQPPAGTSVVALHGLSVPMTVAVRWRNDDKSPLIANVTPFLRKTSGDARSPRVALPRDRVHARPTPIPPGLEVRHLRALLVTAELGSVSRGAERLGLTQSGLSRQIRSLEREPGVSRLQRRANGVVPTAAGEVMREEAQRALALVRDAIAQTRSAGRGIVGRCTVAAVAAEFSGNRVSEALRKVGERHPGITVQVKELLTPQQVLALREGRIDVGIGGANAGVIDDPIVVGSMLSDDVIECALVADNHPLAARARIDPSDLGEYPFIFLDRPTYPQFYDIVMHAFGAIGLVPLISATFNGPRMLWRATAASLGWTLGSRSMMTRPLTGLVAIPIDGLHIPSGIQLLRRRGEKDPAILAVVEAFRQQD